MIVAQVAIAVVMMSAQWLIASRRRIGWALSFAGQLGLIAYVLATDQYGFLPLNSWAAVMAARGWRNHYKAGR